MTIDVIKQYNLDATGITDNVAKLTQLGRDVAAIYAAKTPMPRLEFTHGVLSFSGWPDLAFPNLQIVAEGECRLRYTGTGHGIVFDGSQRNPTANEPGIDNLTFTGFDIYAGPHGTPLVFQGIHRSNLSARVLVFTETSGLPVRAAIQMNFCIITKIHPVVVTGHLNPVTGIWIDAWPGKPNLQTTACTIENPCLEGCSTGIYWNNAGSCMAYGGTIENSDVGIHLGPNAGNNVHYSVEMEGNRIDVAEDYGSKANGFMYCGTGSKLKTQFGPFTTNWVKN